MNTTTIPSAPARPRRTVVTTYYAGLTTRSQLAAVASATLTLFVAGQLVLRWLLL